MKIYIFILQIHLITKIMMHNLHGIYGIFFIDEKSFFFQFLKISTFFQF